MVVILNLQTWWMYGLCLGPIFCVYLAITNRSEQIPRIVITWIIGYCLIYGIRLWLESEMSRKRIPEWKSEYGSTPGTIAR
jgi:uncharacterized membrane protein